MKMMRRYVLILLVLPLFGCTHTPEVPARVLSEGKSELIAVANGDSDAIMMEFAGLRGLLEQNDIALSIVYSMGITQASVWASDAPRAKQLIQRAAQSGELKMKRVYFGKWWKAESAEPSPGAYSSKAANGLTGNAQE